MDVYCSSTGQAAKRFGGTFDPISCSSSEDQENRVDRQLELVIDVPDQAIPDGDWTMLSEAKSLPPVPDSFFSIDMCRQSKKQKRSADSQAQSLDIPPVVSHVQTEELRKRMSSILPILRTISFLPSLSIQFIVYGEITTRERNSDVDGPVRVQERPPGSKRASGWEEALRSSIRPPTISALLLFYPIFLVRVPKTYAFLRTRSLGIARMGFHSWRVGHTWLVDDAVASPRPTLVHHELTISIRNESLRDRARGLEREHDRSDLQRMLATLEEAWRACGRTPAADESFQVGGVAEVAQPSEDEAWTHRR